VAVAVVSWNTRELLRRTLDALRPDADSGLAEVWVVDNASTDGSGDLVRDAYPWVHLIASETNLGYGPAVNLVGRRTAAPWLAAANADVALAPGALAALLDAGRGAPRAGVLAPRLRTPDGRTQHSVHAFPTTGVTLVFNLGLWRLVPGAGERLCLNGQWNPDRRRAVDWAHGAFLLIRRAAWAEIGGFDDGQWLYAEDLDLCWRLARAGWSTHYEPAAAAEHAVSAATRSASWGTEREIRAQASAYAWMGRRLGPARAGLTAAINVGGALARWTPLALAARVDPVRYAHARDVHRGYLRMHLTGLRRPQTRRWASASAANSTTWSPKDRR
jgi:N-acetylglucosaminyl-diphospho-decaprenol L-rhamnosyltransferase